MLRGGCTRPWIRRQAYFLLFYVPREHLNCFIRHLVFFLVVFHFHFRRVQNSLRTSSRNAIRTSTEIVFLGFGCQTGICIFPQPSVTPAPPYLLASPFRSVVRAWKEAVVQQHPFSLVEAVIQFNSTLISLLLSSLPRKSLPRKSFPSHSFEPRIYSRIPK